MRETEVASIICQDLNTYDEEPLKMEPFMNGVEAVSYLNQQWVSQEIQIKEATEEKIRLSIHEKDVIITNQNIFRDWQIDY